MFISGDMNARTKDLPDYIIDDSVNYVPVPDFYISDDFSLPRKSRDIHGDINLHGQSLLNMCCAFHVHMLNGRIPGDEEGHLTCFTSNGSSLVDYTFVSSQLFPIIDHFEIGQYDDFTHLPQLCRIHVKSERCRDSVNQRENIHENSLRKYYRWSADSFETMVKSKYIAEIEENINSGLIDTALHSFDKLIHESCISTKKVRSRKQKSEWWDDEMRLLKSEKMRYLRELRKVPSDRLLQKYREIRKVYKTKIREKKELLRNTNKKKIESCKSASDFWKFIRMKADNNKCVNHISIHEWKKYFEELLNCKESVDVDFGRIVEDFMFQHDRTCELCENNDTLDELNCDITLEETEDAISDLANGKSPGLDGVTNNIIKSASALIAPILCKLFNKVLESKYFPEHWSHALIIPIHKKGDVQNPDNYRGISLLSSLGKLFTKIINKRLNSWADSNNKIFENQAGFRKGKSSIDQIYILQSIVSKYLTKKKGRFYSVYVDFAKAFDSVPHLQLFYSLIQEGLHGRLLFVLRDMYRKLNSQVQSCDSNISETFSCTIGTRQGCMISPFLFIMYMNELVKEANERECKGVYVDENFKNINMLLYADDLVLLGDIVGHIEQLLDNLSLFCKKWGLTVNMDKTNFMVFRNGGIVKNNERVYFDGKRIALSPYYKYLRLIMSTRLSWTPAQRTLSLQAEKSMNFIQKINYECNFSFTSSNILFDKCIIPIATYGSEIWGANFHSVTENLLIKFCRKQLGVGSKSCAPALLGECGKHGLYINCYVKMVKYWLKLVNIEDVSLLKSCYDMLFQLSKAGRCNWASGIRAILYKYGFGHVWEAKDVEDINRFLREFKERLYDCDMQEWSEKLSNMPKLRTYCIFKTDFITEPYLLLSIPYRLRSALAKYRISSHDLEIEKGRHRNIPHYDRICKLCRTLNMYFIEDEYHVLMQCSFYNDLRCIYLKLDSLPVNLHTFKTMMKSDDPKNLTMLASFVANMFKLRRSLWSSL